MNYIQAIKKYIRKTGYKKPLPNNAGELAVIYQRETRKEQRRNED